MSPNHKSIAFVCHPYHRGGVTRWMVDMVIAYQKQGYETHFITVQPRQRFISAGKSETMIQLLRTSGYEGRIAAQPVGHTFELAGNAYRAAVYKSSIEKSVPKGSAIILSDDYAVWQGACALASDYKVIAVIHCSMSESYYAQTQMFFKQLSGIVTVSQRSSEKLNLTEEKPLLMQPCGIPIRRPANSIPMQRSSQLKGLKLRIAWAGRMENSQKRISDLVLIAERLKQKELSFVFDIIGEGSAKSSLIAEIKAKGLKDYFVFHGWQSKAYIEEILQAAQLYILPSNYEGYPVAVMEAFANGCVVVSSRVSGIEDLEKESDTADVLKVFEIGDVQKAAEHVMVLQDADFVTLAQKAKVLAYKYFSIETCAKNYQNFIEGIPDNKTVENSVITYNKFKEELMAQLRYWKYKIFN